MYLISAYFDETTTKKLQEYINRIYEATGNGFMVENHVPPHMTISAMEARNVDVLVPGFESLEGSLTSQEIQIVSLGQFLPYVFYGAPVLNDYLQQMSQNVFDTFKDIPEVTVSRYYRPGSWLPHITLGKQLSKEQMSQALEAMQDFTPIKGKIVRIGLSTVNPHMDIRIITLE